MKFRSPKYDEASVEVPDEVANIQQPFSGSVCSKKGDEYEIDHNIIDFLGDERPKMTWGQYTNQWGMAAKWYEEVWRKRSLTILSGQQFPIEQEQQLLLDWVKPKADGTYLDVGCSTALYGRTLKKVEKNCRVVALDFSTPMLREARQKAYNENTNLYLMRGDAHFLPCYAAAFDGVLMGGTLNELADPLKVLYECRRVLTGGGALFMMHLLETTNWYSRLLQKSTTYGGLKFWDVRESNQLFERAGFSVADQQRQGIVCFSKLMAA